MMLPVLLRLRRLNSCRIVPWLVMLKQSAEIVTLEVAVIGITFSKPRRIGHPEAAAYASADGYSDRHASAV